MSLRDHDDDAVGDDENVREESKCNNELDSPKTETDVVARTFETINTVSHSGILSSSSNLLYVSCRLRNIDSNAYAIDIYYVIRPSLVVSGTNGRKRCG